MLKFVPMLLLCTLKNEQNDTFKKAAAVQEPPPGTLLILFKSAVGDSIKINNNFWSMYSYGMYVRYTYLL